MNAEISATASSPPNFAGHFRLVQFSCGTECTGFVVIDVLTGRRVATDTVDFPYEIGFWQRPELPHGFQYQPESALLVVQGCFLKKPCGSYYYVMVGTDLTLKEVRKFKPQPHRIRHG